MNFLHHYDPDDPYPESDGLPMAENTAQYDWLVKIKENLEILFADRADVFIAGDLLWYPVPDRQLAYPVAPDVMVAIGRPKGRRGSYKQWEEGDIAPQVVFEILSPSNSISEMRIKKNLYDQYGVQEYYVYNPDNNRLEVWIRPNGHLRKIPHIHGWVSPLLGIRFALDAHTLRIFYPSGKAFLNSVELNQYAEAESRRAEAESRRAEAALLDKHAALQNQEVERQRAEAERHRAEAALLDKHAALQNQEVERQRAKAAEQRAVRLAAQLRALGIDPE